MEIIIELNLKLHSLPYNVGVGQKGIVMENVTNESEYVNSKELARMIAFSRKFIEKHRQYIAGAVKIGGQWRFSIAEIRARLVTGRDIIIKPNHGGEK